MEAAGKPLLRGHIHQAAFFMAIGACIMLLLRCNDPFQFLCVTFYSVCLIALFGISALYHRPNWDPRRRVWMRRLDHAAIYLLILGTATPICLIGMKDVGGTQLLTVLGIGAALGVLQSLFWVHAPKWLSVVLYTAAGCLAVPYIREMKSALGDLRVTLILVGGFFYFLGAVAYGMKRPNPVPSVFGYHEVFHLLVVVAAIFHFGVVSSLVGF